MVHQVFLAEVAAVFHLVVNAVPRLDAYKRRMLSVGCPDAHAGRLHVDGHHWIHLLVEQLHLLHLTFVYNHAVVSERVFVEMPQSVFTAHGEASWNDASAHVSDKAFYRALVVESDGSLGGITLFDAGNQEGRMTANLEMDFVVVGIVHMPYHMNLIAFQPVGDAHHEMVGIVVARLGRVFQGEGHLRVCLGNELEVHVAGESVARQFIRVAVNLVGVFPKTAHDGEEDGRVASPVFRVGLP